MPSVPTDEPRTGSGSSLRSRPLHLTPDDGNGGYCGHWSVGHHFPGLVRGTGGRVSPSLLPSAQPAASLRVQVIPKALFSETTSLKMSSKTIKDCIITVWFNILFITVIPYTIVLALLKLKYAVSKAVTSLTLLKCYCSSPPQTHSGSDWSDGDSERAVRVGAGRRSHHQPAHRSHPGERGVDRRCLVWPLHHVLLCSHDDNYTHAQLNITLTSLLLITPLIVSVCLSLSAVV